MICSGKFSKRKFLCFPEQRDQNAFARKERTGYLFLMADPKRIKCPTCKNVGDWFATDYGPFCSKRCKMVDLGKWFSEENTISERLKPDHFKGFENLPAGEGLDQPD